MHGTPTNASLRGDSGRCVLSNRPECGLNVRKNPSLDSPLIDVTLATSERQGRVLAHPYDVCGFFAILCSPPLANVLQMFSPPVLPA